MFSFWLHSIFIRIHKYYILLSHPLIFFKKRFEGALSLSPSNSSTVLFRFKWIHFDCYCPTPPDVGAIKPESMSISPQLPPVARTTPHTHTHSQDYDFMSVREGRREQPASPPLSSQPARSSPPALDDAGMHFGRRGAGQQGPTSSTATEPDMNDKWRRCLRGARHRNVLQSAALRTGSLQQYFCTFLDLPRLACDSRNPIINRESLACMWFYFRRPFYSIFWGAVGGIPFVKPEGDKLLSMALVMEPVSKWSSGQVVDWMKGRTEPWNVFSAAASCRDVELQLRVVDSVKMPKKNKNTCWSSAFCLIEALGSSLESLDPFVLGSLTYSFRHARPLDRKCTERV